MSSLTDPTWSPISWQKREIAQATAYPDPNALRSALDRLRSLPPLVTSWEVERLKTLLAQAQAGERFILQGGDCAETLADCQAPIISRKLKILLQMSLVLMLGSKKPVIRIGRFAGQYAKPRSQAVEVRTSTDGSEERLPNYFGDLINRAEFTADARRADPDLLVTAYQHAALTLNFIRSLSAGGFADLHHPEYWDLGFFQEADLPDELRRAYDETRGQLHAALQFMRALDKDSGEHLRTVDFFTSHEGLNLHYESAQTIRVPRFAGYYDLSTHFPWIGERTRQIDGAHVEFFRGVRNPVGVKIGPSSSGDDLRRLIDVLNPDNEAGKLAFITRMGKTSVRSKLPPLLEKIQRDGRAVLWICDPMHGNTHQTQSGFKTRRFPDILAEIESTLDVHDQVGTTCGGVHFELTGEDVTECLGGAAGVREEDLHLNYATACDPRLNYRQAIEMSFCIVRHLRGK